jgi:uncharacterized protein YndB with AHSA1/START domain
MTARPEAATPEAAARPAARELLITRAFDAPRRLVFRAWTDPAHLVRWWGPRGFTTPFCKMDAQPGGTWRVCMRSPEGSEHWLRCIYREVLEPERLVFSWAWEDAQGEPGHETLVSVDFVEVGAKTKLIVHQAVFESIEARDAHQRGWTGCLDCLEEYLATA